MKEKELREELKEHQKWMKFHNLAIKSLHGEEAYKQFMKTAKRVKIMTEKSDEESETQKNSLIRATAIKKQSKQKVEPNHFRDFSFMDKPQISDSEIS